MTKRTADRQLQAEMRDAAATISLADAKFTDQAVQERPNAFYRALRQQDPIHREETLGMYLVSRYDDLKTVLRDPVTFSMEKGYYSQMAHGYLDDLKAVLMAEGGGWFPDVVNIDPPRHARARALTQQAFTARRMSALQPRFEQLVDELIDGFVGTGELEGLQDLALPMAIGFSTGQLNITDLEQASIRRWGAAYLAQFSLLENRDHVMKIARDLCEMQNYLIALVQKRVTNPGEDMLSDLVRARIDHDQPQLRFDELVATARAILINTHDSVSTALTNILFAVATDGEIAQQFYAAADDDERMGRIVEEILRLEPPVRAMSRVTTEPVELGGVQLPEGAHLLLLFASANDDDAMFEDARAFNLDRRNLVRNFTFGAGTHLCMGIALARMQLRVAARKVAQRMKKLRLSVPIESIRYVPNVALLAMERLPLRFDPVE